jgi:hypothetical protein
MKPAKNKTKRPKLEYFLLFAQLLTLVAFALGLQFLLNTTGGTLFLFSLVGPGLVTVAVIILAGAGFYAFRRQHQLFEYELVEPGEVVFEQGQPGDCAYFIEHGEVEVLRAREGQAPTLVATLTSGQFFGESALIANDPRNATIRAKTSTKLAVLGKENFVAMCKLVPSARKDIMQAFQERIDKGAKKSK